MESTAGLLLQFGVLNGIDFLLFDSLPTDLVWLLQTFTIICVGFGLVKIAFDDLSPGWTRSCVIATSPILLFFYVIMSLHILLLGLGNICNGIDRRSIVGDEYLDLVLDLPLNRSRASFLTYSVQSAETLHNLSSS